jgi:hypothetical protein
MVTAGFDVAMNHSAMVISECGKPIAWRFLLEKPKGVHEANEPISQLYTDKRKAKGPQRSSVLWDRLINFKLWATSAKELMRAHGVERIGVEDYAMGRTHNAYHIGECGGVLRAICSELKLGEIELIAPRAIKSRAGIKGKDKPFEFCSSELGVDFSGVDAGFASSESGGDLADAAVVSLITWERHNGNCQDTKNRK